jgi:phage terminase large subunit
MILDLRRLANPKIVSPKFYPLLKDKSRYLVLYGGAGSGKSYFAAQQILIRMLSNKRHKFLVLRKVGKTIRNSVYARLKSQIASWGLQDIIQARDGTLSFINTLNGNEIITSGIDDPEKIKSIDGITGVWIEEASELTPDDFDQLDLRVRGVHHTYIQFILSFNPIIETHWLKKRFFDRIEDDATVVHSTYKDNPFLDAGYIRALEKKAETNPHYFEVYALGKWGSLGGLVFTNYEVIKMKPDPYQFSMPYWGVDWGFNDPTAFNGVAMRDGCLYVFDERHATEKTTRQLIELAKGEWKLDPDLIYLADSAEPDRIMEFRNAGYRKMQGVKKGKGSRMAAYNWAKSLPKIYIADHCVETIKEFQSHKYLTDKDGNRLEEPEDANNHHIDAILYGTRMMQAQQQRGKIRAVTRF